MNRNKNKKTKILLALLPYWTPLVPPQGISCLKSFLEPRGFDVKTVDANTEPDFRRLYDRYFDLIRGWVPKEQQGNFYNLGHDVLRNHMTAHIHQEDETRYLELVGILVYQTFFVSIDTEQARTLSAVFDEFYAKLDVYLRRLLTEEKPDVFGVSVMRDTVGPSLYGFRLAKEMDPSVLTVMGGSIFADVLFQGTPNFDYFVERTPYIDHIVIGEGQNILHRLLIGEIPQNKKILTLADCGGETLGFSPVTQPDMSDFDVQHLYPYLSGQASKSCPFRCSFCNVKAFYGDYKAKDPLQSAEEMVNLHKKHGVQLFFMNDSLLNYAADALSNALIESGVSIYWDGYLRVGKEVTDRDTTTLWRKGGYYRARLGVESGSQKVLDSMGKHITPQLIEESLFSLAMAGIKTTTYWVIGHPGETEEDFQQTLDLLERLKDYIYQAECNTFICGYTGQAKTDEWAPLKKKLYPDWARPMLIMETWYVEGDPTRQEMYKRAFRFVEHCEKLGIPNPYSLHEIYQADERWHRLHKHAVPRLAELDDAANYVNENLDVGRLVCADTSDSDDGDFGF
jgi:radical SAM superfamily enzyme YgiQ (UPF0313 family)